eukprot:3413677-Pleurochrysis_carterae.AAC.2
MFVEMISPARLACASACQLDWGLDGVSDGASLPLIVAPYLLLCVPFERPVMLLIDGYNIAASCRVCSICAQCFMMSACCFFGWTVDAWMFKKVLTRMQLDDSIHGVDSSLMLMVI